VGSAESLITLLKRFSLSSLKMFCKNCHSSGGLSGVYTPHNLMDGKRNTYPSRHFVCNTCRPKEGDMFSQGEDGGMFFSSQTARKLLCHPLPSIYRSQEDERTMLDEKGNHGTKLSAPLAVRTFDIDDFAFGAISTTFTHHPLSSSPESANSGPLHESNTGKWPIMEAKHPLHFSSSSQRQSKGAPGLLKIHDSNVSYSDFAYIFESVKKREEVPFRQTRNWLKKQTRSGSVFIACGRKLQGQGISEPAYAHMNKSPSISVKTNSSLGRLKSVDRQNKLSRQDDLDEDMRRILYQLNANFKLQALGCGPE